MDSEWQLAHRRALAHIQLDQPEEILEDIGIPEHLRERMWRFVTGEDGTEPDSIPNKSENWFQDLDKDSNWSRYVDLLDRKCWSNEVIQNIEISTRKAMNFLFDPRSEDVEKKYGLVVGHVQSGKTANYTGLISRAVDSGYNVIVVLAGLHNNLRRQTQLRLERELMGRSRHPEGHHVRAPQNYDWINLTTEEDDFQELPTSAFLSSRSPVIAVIKKNKAPLTKIRDMFLNYPEEKRSKLNLLIIDDEADHATINTRKREEMTEEESEFYDWLEDEYDEEDWTDEEFRDATTINTRIREIIQIFERSAYVGYTATPFANVLISESYEHPTLGKTLYPRDFIMALPKPEGHMGLDEFFPESVEDGQFFSQIEVVPVEHAEELRSFESDSYILDFEVPKSLENAIIDYLLSGAVRRKRGEVGFHHSMLIHSKHLTTNQNPISKKVEALVGHWNNHILNEYSSEGSQLRERFRDRWKNCFENNPSTPETWDDISEDLMLFIHEGYAVMEINSKSEHSLDYGNHHEEGLRVIAVGGNRLSRGLTLEGLCSTYFIRESRMYDTLTQMGRWFGFRPGYSDLVRLHVTPTLLEWFSWITGVERELRNDIERYGLTGMKPSQLAVRVMKHRRMLPTSPGKMRDARAFSGGMDASCPRMKKFLYHSIPELRQNLSTTSQFLTSLGAPSENEIDDSLLWRDVDPDMIISLLQSFNFHEEDRSFDQFDIINHINTRAGEGELSSWSVCLISNSKGTRTSPFSDFGFDHEFGLPTRSRLMGSESIGELMQPMHFCIDLHGGREIYRTDGKFDYNKMYEIREPENGLLIFYIIDKNSKISAQARQTRQPLFGEGQEREHIVAMAIAFPRADLTDEERESQAGFWAQKGMTYEPNNEPEGDG